jgi:hypothetical protein
MPGQESEFQRGWHLGSGPRDQLGGGGGGSVVGHSGSSVPWSSASRVASRQQSGHQDWSCHLSPMKGGDNRFGKSVPHFCPRLPFSTVDDDSFCLWMAPHSENRAICRTPSGLLQNSPSRCCSGLTVPALILCLMTSEPQLPTPRSILRL